MSASNNSNVTLFRWELVDMCKQRNDACSIGLTSKTFSLQNRSSVQFEMFIYYGNDMKGQNDVRVILKQLDGKPLEASVKIWIESTSGQKFNETSIGKHTFDKVGNFCGNKQFGGNEYKNFWELYKNHETFYVCCEFTDLNTYVIPIINCEQEFHQDQWNLYEEEHYDAIVKVGETEFKVMKAFFMAHSKVFKNMFTSNFKEGIKSEIDIKDIDEETMKHLIKWLYTSNFERVFPIEKLFVAADKYDIALLKKLCAQRMLTTLDGGNAFQRLITASLYNDTQLKEASLKCISGLPSVHFADFFISDEWHNFYANNNAAAREVEKLIQDKLHKRI